MLDYRLGLAGSRATARANGVREEDLPGLAARDLAGFDFRDDMFTGRFNADEFAQLMSVAADLGVRDFSQASDPAALREMARVELRSRRAAGDTTTSLDDIVTEMQRNEALIAGTGNVAQVADAMRGAFGANLSPGQLGNMMRTMGLTPGNGGDVDRIRDVVMQLRALGDAAGMSAEQMLQAGQTLQQQFGGSATYNTAVAASMQSTMRVFGEIRNAGDSTVRNIGIDERRSSDFAQGQLGMNAAPSAGLLAAVQEDDVLRAQLDAAMAESPEAAAAFLQNLADTNPALVSRAMAFTPERIAASMQDFGRRNGDIDFVRMQTIMRRNDLMRVAEASGRGFTVGGRSVELGGLRALDTATEDEMRAIYRATRAVNISGDLSEQELARLDEFGERTGVNIRDLVRVGNIDSVTRNIFESYFAERGIGMTEAERQSSVNRQQIVSMLQSGGLGDEGMGRLLQVARSGDLVGEITTAEGLTDLLVKSSLLRDEDTTLMLQRMAADPSVADSMIADFEALRVAARTGTAEELTAAQDLIREKYGVQTKVELPEEMQAGVAANNLASSFEGLNDVVGDVIDYFAELLPGGGGGAQSDGDGAAGATAAGGTPAAREAVVRVRLEVESDSGVVVSDAQQQDTSNGVEVSVNNSASRAP